MANLLLASRLGNIDEIKLFLSNGTSVNVKDDYGRTPLYKTSQYNHLKCVEFLIEQGAEIDCKEEVHGRTALMVSAKNGHTEIVQKLVEHKAGIDKVDNENMTALFYATVNNHLDTVRYILEQNPNKEIKENYDDRTVILEASEIGNPDLVELLLRNGVCVNKTDSSGNSALILASRNNHLDVVKLLLKYQADIDCQDKFGSSALNCAIVRGNFDIVKELVERGCNMELSGYGCDRPIILAADLKNEEIITYLLQKGANVNSQNSCNVTALHCAAMNGNCKIISILLENGAEINAVSNETGTPLCSASMNGHTKAVSFLLDAGADVNFQCNTGHTVWLSAFMIKEYRKNEIVELLLNAGANTEMCTDRGETALHLAFYTQYQEVVDLLVSKGANVNAITKENETPLMYACRYETKCEKISLLIQNGANVNSVSKDKMSPLHYATKTGRADLIPLLIKSGADTELKNNKGLTPLHLGCVCAIETVNSSNCDVWSSDEETDADGRKENKEGVSRYYANLHIVKTLLENEANVNACTYDGDTCLHLSFGKEYKRIVIYLIDLLLSYKPLILKNKDNKTPIDVALDYTRVLLDYVEGSNYPVKDKSKRKDYKSALSFEAEAKDNKNLLSHMKVRTDKIIGSDIADALKQISNNEKQAVDPAVDMVKSTFVIDFSDKHLFRLAKKLDKDWKAVAALLGVSRTTIKQITKESEGDMYAAWDMLLHWRDGATGSVSDKRGILREAMEEADRTDLVDII